MYYDSAELSERRWSFDDQDIAAELNVAKMLEVDLRVSLHTAQPESEYASRSRGAWRINQDHSLRADQVSQ